MFKPDTLIKLSSLNEHEIVWMIEKSYAGFAKDYYKYMEQARRLEGVHVPDKIPSPYPHIAAMNQDRDEERESSLKNAKQALKLCNVLDGVLKDLREARHQAFGAELVEFFRSRK